MKITLLVIMSFYTLFIVGGIHYYEDKIKNLKLAISDYKKALNISRNHYNAEHYTWLQINNKQLGEENEALQKQINSIKAENAALNNGIPLQYEFSAWKPTTWNASYEARSSGYANYTELELERYQQEILDFDQ